MSNDQTNIPTASSVKEAASDDSVRHWDPLVDDPIRTDEDRRRIKARWIITADLTITSSSQIGSHAAYYCDQTFGRTPEGKPLLQGSTLAGALRSALDDIQEGYRSELRQTEDSSADQAHPPKASGGTASYRRFSEILFGSATEYESPVIVFDSKASGKGPFKGNIRDGVRLDPQTRTAVDKLKFDREVCLAELDPTTKLTFPIRLEVIVPAIPIDESASFPEEKQILEMVGMALEQLASGRIAFGARTSRGLGACAASNFRAERFDMTSLQDWKAYAESGYTGLLPGKARSSIRTAIEPYFPELENLQPEEDRRRRLLITLDLRIDGTLLVRSPGQKVGDADVIHLTENGKHFLSGTSLAGALRAHANRIANTVHPAEAPPICGIQTEKRDRGREHPLIASLFGPSPEDIRYRKVDPMASRVRIREVTLLGSKEHRHTRVKIDRFTGDALDTALFDEQPAVGGTLKVEIEVWNASDEETGLMLLVTRDLAEGLLPLGGGSSIGRGVVRGQDGLESVRVTLPCKNECQPLAAMQRYVDRFVQRHGSAPTSSLPAAGISTAGNPTAGNLTGVIQNE